MDDAGLFPPESLPVVAAHPGSSTRLDIGVAVASVVGVGSQSANRIPRATKAIDD
jgi:hypothetical protein